MEKEISEIESLEIDAFDLMKGKMSEVLLKRLHKQTSSK